MQDLIGFAADRIQEQEQLPEINPELAKSIKDVGGAIVDASAERIKSVSVEDFVSMLEGVPANHSLQVVVDMLNSKHGELVRSYLEGARASLTRVEYFEKLSGLAELFTPTRVSRITVTAQYIEAGWGWRNA